MNNMSFVKGIGLGLIVGSVVGMVVMPKRKRTSVGKALRSMGDVVENVAGTIGL
jgi:gas vesicle protein